MGNTMGMKFYLGRIEFQSKKQIYCAKKSIGLIDFVIIKLVSLMLFVAVNRHAFTVSTNIKDAILNP